MLQQRDRLESFSSLSQQQNFSLSRYVMPCCVLLLSHWKQSLKQFRFNLVKKPAFSSVTYSWGNLQLFIICKSKTSLCMQFETVALTLHSNPRSIAFTKAESSIKYRFSENGNCCFDFELKPQEKSVLQFRFPEYHYSGFFQFDVTIKICSIHFSHGSKWVVARRACKNWEFAGCVIFWLCLFCASVFSRFFSVFVAV